MSPFATAVREGDRTLYLSTLFAAETVRPALHALAAYTLELDQVVARAREPMAAEVRLKWWAEAVENRGFGEGAGLPVIDALRAASTAYAWPTRTLAAMAEARAVLLYADPFADWNAFDGYAGETAGAAVQLSAMALAVAARGPEEGLAQARTAAEAAGYAGVARTAATAAATEVARHRARRTLLPQAEWQALGVDWRTAVEADEPVPTDSAVKVLAAHGRAAADACAARLAAIPPALRPAFIAPMAARAQLRRIERRPNAAHHLSHPVAQTLSVWRAARRMRRV